MSVQVKGSGTIGGLDEGLVVSGIVTATSFSGSGANLTGIDLGAVTGATGDFSIADKIVHTGDTNTFIRFPSDDSFSVTTNNVTRMTFTGNFIDLPDAGTLRLGNSNDLQISHGSGGASNIVHSNTSQPLIISATGAGSIRFDTNSTERLRIDSSGHLHTGYTSSFGNDHINILASDGGGIAIAQNNAGNATSGTVIGSLSIQGYLSGADYTSAEARISGIAAANHTGSSAATDMVFYTKPSSTGPGSAPTERLRITSDGKLTMSSGTVELQSHMVRVGNRTRTQINAGVSTSTGALTLDTSTNNLLYYANSQWATVKKVGNDGSTQSLAARSAKALLDDGFTTSGVYFLDMHGAYTSGNAKRHYCLMDSSYDGGGWTLLWCMNHGNNFASGHNYSYSLNVGSNPSSINDFTASNFGYDRRNTFTPQANDQFLIRRSDNNDWRRFVVTTWSPTANSISDGWTCSKSTEGTQRNHPYYALGQMYDTSGNAVSGMVHFNGCAVGGNCATGGGDSDGFGDHVNWSSGYAPYNCWGGAFNGQGNGGSPLYWGQTALSQGGSLYLQMFYRRTGTQ